MHSNLRSAHFLEFFGRFLFAPYKPTEIGTHESHKSKRIYKLAIFWSIPQNEGPDDKKSIYLFVICPIICSQNLWKINYQQVLCPVDFFSAHCAKLRLRCSTSVWNVYAIFVIRTIWWHSQVEWTFQHIIIRHESFISH